MSDAPRAASQDLLVIKEGDTVILDVNGEKRSFLKFRKDGEVKVGREYCTALPILGAPYGSLFEVSTAGKGLAKRRRVCETAGEDWEGLLEIERNNSSLRDAGTANQALTSQDISRLRSEGKSGDEIIAALTTHSATFETKTQYSQDKYKRKKAKKYLTHATLIRPTASSIAEVYFAKTPVKIGGIRPDSLAILLTLANIGAGCRGLVVDGVSGLITGAALERMGGQGSLVSGHLGSRAPAADIINLFNFPEATRKAPITASLIVLKKYLEDVGNTEAQEAAEDFAMPMETANGKAVADPADGAQAIKTEANVQAERETTSAAQETAPHESAADAQKMQEQQVALAVDSPLGKANSTRPEPSAEELAQYAKEREEKEKKLRHLCRQGFQSCIVAVPNAHPAAVLKAVMPLLAPSASFAVFFSTLQPLANCMHELQGSRSAVAMQLQESWWREYQVLPGRTHPQMSTSGTGGYILSGIKVIAQ